MSRTRTIQASTPRSVRFDIRARPDFCAAICGVAGVEYDESRIVDPAVGIFESRIENARLQRPSQTIGSQVQCARSAQLLSPADMVVKKKAEAKHPRRTQSGSVRQKETQRPNDVGRRRPQNFPLGQRLPDQTKLVIFQIAQTAVDELRRPGRGAAGEIAHLAQDHAQAASRRVAGDAASIDPPADDDQVDDPLQRRAPAAPILGSDIAFFYGYNESETKASRRFDRAA